ncbi:MAG: class I SAM-dependent methyltransferase [Candidatus Hydrogenedentota bacterium]
MKTELDLFENATNWKSYWASFVSDFIEGDILEVGAGTGGNLRHLYRSHVDSWVCVEPDTELIASLQSSIDSLPSEFSGQIIEGTIRDLPEVDRFDAIFYIDVIEHIEDDREELEVATSRLKPGGRLIILVPAHNWLFSPFDASIGHFRRYTRRSLQEVIPPNLMEKRLIYLDSVGMLASLANRLILRSSTPTAKQIDLWDKRIVPVSRIIDPVAGYRLGKTVVGIWENPS